MNMVEIFLKSPNVAVLSKVNRDRYNIDGPECKKRAYMYLELRTLNNMEI